LPYEVCVGFRKHKATFGTLRIVRFVDSEGTYDLARRSIMRTRKIVVLASVVSCVVSAVPAQGVLIEIQLSNPTPEPVSTPVTCTIPISPTEQFSFDLVITDPQGVSAQGFQAVVSVSRSGGSGGLRGYQVTNPTAASDSDYWLCGNSAGAVFIDHGDGSYTFGDSPDDAVPQLLQAGDIVARYEFTWDGTHDFYTFTLDPDATRSFVLDDSFAKQPLSFPAPEDPEECPRSSGNSFTVFIPEPSTLILIGLGGLILRKKRR
jgi:hypothetical protein